MIRACLMLQNEAHCIARTIHSIGRHVDAYTCIDTGSTDGTPAIVRSVFGQYHVPGEVYFRAFTDYATTRNELIELAGDDEPFLLMLDAEDELERGDSLRFLLRIAPADQSCFVLRQVWPDIAVDVPRIVRAGSPWRYRGKIHEVLTHPDGATTTALFGPILRHTPTEIGRARSRARYPFDVQTLQAHLLEHPDDERARWHLDRTLAAMACEAVDS